MTSSAFGSNAHGGLGTATITKLKDDYVPPDFYWSHITDSVQYSP